jgi:hypothetical protein
MSRLTRIALVALLFAARDASADTNPASIAVPILGTQGPGAAYPSTITVAARGGAAHTSEVSIVLHAVTHPCPEELAVLLVHGTQKYLVMSHAGGCRALQGTDIQFKVGGGVNPIPDTQPATPAYAQWFDAAPSNYGAVPVFPAPAPAGPYTLGLPPAGTNVNGTWALYVMDTAALNRGVIAGGWSVNYDTNPQFIASQALVAIPTMGPAQSYPITFNLTSVPTDVTVRGVVAEISFQHTFPDHLRMVLQSPEGTPVVLMANAGGDANFAPSKLTFLDNANQSLPDSTAIAPGFYKPTTFGSPTIPAPGPTSGYQTTLASFEGELARGTWKLWVYDDTALDSGTLTTARLTVVTEEFLSTILTSVPAAANQPFVTPGTSSFSADIPLKKGTNVVSFRALNTAGYLGGGTTDIAVNEFTYSFAEGATGSFFDLDLTLANPQGTDAPFTIDFLPEGGAPIPFAGSIAASSSFPLAVDTVVPAASVSAVVHSTNGVRLAAERAMYLPGQRLFEGGHESAGVNQTSKQWFLAEGATGSFFDCFVLISNPNSAAANVNLSYLPDLHPAGESESISGGGASALPQSRIHGAADLHAESVEPSKHLRERRCGGAWRGHVQRRRAGAELSADRGGEGVVLERRRRSLRRRHQRHGHAFAATVGETA